MVYTMISYAKLWYHSKSYDITVSLVQYHRSISWLWYHTCDIIVWYHTSGYDIIPKTVISHDPRFQMTHYFHVYCYLFCSNGSITASLLLYYYIQCNTTSITTHYYVRVSLAPSEILTTWTGFGKIIRPCTDIFGCTWFTGLDIWNPLHLVQGSTRWYVLVRASTYHTRYKAVQETSKWYIPVRTNIGSYQILAGFGKMVKTCLNHVQTYFYLYRKVEPVHIIFVPVYTMYIKYVIVHMCLYIYVYSLYRHVCTSSNTQHYFDSIQPVNYCCLIAECITPVQWDVCCFKSLPKSLFPS